MTCDMLNKIIQDNVSQMAEEGKRKGVIVKYIYQMRYCGQHNICEGCSKYDECFEG
jgi:hypothetical protein